MRTLGCGVVIVTFHPSPDRIDNLIKISKEAQKIVVVDNGSSNLIVELLKRKVTSHNIKLIANASNIGLACALNQGVSWLLNQNYKWILTLDQDSLPNTGTIATLLEVAECNWLVGKKGIFALNPVEEITLTDPTLLAKNQNNDVEVIIVKTAITSGSLFNRCIFTGIGLFDNQFFIDYIDHEYCLRASLNGYKTYLAKKLLMLHNSGSPQKCLFMGKSFYPQNYSAERLFYKTRNRLVVYKTYWLRELPWIARDIIGFFKDLIKLLLFEKKKCLKLLGILRGWYSALFMKTILLKHQMTEPQTGDIISSNK